MNPKKKIETADNPVPKKTKSATDMAEVPSSQDIYSLLLKVAQDLGKVAQDVTDVKESMDELSMKVAQVDCRVSALESSNASMSSEISGSFRAYKNLKDDFHKGRAKTLELDLKIRCRNIRIIGLEEEENEDLNQKVLDVLKSSVKYGQTTLMDIDNTFRIGKKLGPQSKARHVLISFMCTRIKEEVLKAARLLEMISYKQKRIFIYPDYPKEVVEIRKSFKEPKELARSMGVKAFLNRTNWLTLVFPEGEKITTDPNEALKWLKAARDTPSAKMDN